MYKDIQPRILRMRQLTEYTGLSRAYIYQCLKEGSFPSGFTLSLGVRVWEKSEVDAWIDQRKRRA